MASTSGTTAPPRVLSRALHLHPLAFDPNMEVAALSSLESALLLFHPFAAESEARTNHVYKMFYGRRELAKGLSATHHIHSQDLSFSLKDLDALSSTQLVLVQFHPEATELFVLKAYRQFMQRRERDTRRGHVWDSALTVEEVEEQKTRARTLSEKEKPGVQVPVALAPEAAVASTRTTWESPILPPPIPAPTLLAAAIAPPPSSTVPKASTSAHVVPAPNSAPVHLPPIPSRTPIPIEVETGHLFTLKVTDIPLDFFHSSNHKAPYPSNANSLPVYSTGLLSNSFSSLFPPSLPPVASFLVPLDSRDACRAGFVAFKTFEERTLAFQAINLLTVGRWKPQATFEGFGGDADWQWRDLKDGMWLWKIANGIKEQPTTTTTTTTAAAVAGPLSYTRPIQIDTLVIPSSPAPAQASSSAPIPVPPYLPASSALVRYLVPLRIAYSFKPKNKTQTTVLLKMFPRLLGIHDLGEIKFLAFENDADANAAIPLLQAKWGGAIRISRTPTQDWESRDFYYPRLKESNVPHEFYEPPAATVAKTEPVQPLSFQRAAPPHLPAAAVVAPTPPIVQAPVVPRGSSPPSPPPTPPVASTSAPAFSKEHDAAGRRLPPGWERRRSRVSGEDYFVDLAEYATFSNPLDPPDEEDEDDEAVIVVEPAAVEGADEPMEWEREYPATSTPVVPSTSTLPASIPIPTPAVAVEEDPHHAANARTISRSSSISHASTRPPSPAPLIIPAIPPTLLEVRGTSIPSTPLAALTDRLQPPPVAPLGPRFAPIPSGSGPQFASTSGSNGGGRGGGVSGRGSPSVRGSPSTRGGKSGLAARLTSNAGGEPSSPGGGGSYRGSPSGKSKGSPGGRGRGLGKRIAEDGGGGGGKRGKGTGSSLLGRLG